MKIKVGELEVLANGTTIVPPNNQLQLVLDEAGPPLTFKFNFVTNTDKKDPNVSIKNVEPTSIEFDFENFANVFGSGSKEITKIGTFKNRELFFSYRVNFLSAETGVLFVFCFYLGKEVQP